MAGKKKLIKDSIAITSQMPRFVGYSDYYFQTPVKIQIKNTSPEPIAVCVRIEDKSGLIVPFSATAEVPFESALELFAESIFNPVMLAESAECNTVPVFVRAEIDGKCVCEEENQVTILPYDWWEGLSGNAERLAAFVRPRLPECARVLEEAGKRLKKWNESGEFLGYSGTDKNGVRQVVAAVYAALKHFDVEESGARDWSVPVRAVGECSVLKGKQASRLEFALFAAACLEAAGLRPLIAVGKENVGVGAWLYESCFLDSVTDDCEIIEKYIGEGINNLCFFDVEDLFSEKTVAFTSAEGHFAHKIHSGAYESVLDLYRCRAGGVKPLPLKGKGPNGYELYRAEELSDEAAPKPLREYHSLSVDTKLTRNKQWERRLLDLTTKNTLLNFAGKNALHLYCADGDGLYALLEAKGEMKLAAGEETEDAFEERLSQKNRELIALEQKKGVLRAFATANVLQETAVRLIRKNRDADEETGAKILYLAFGFLRYVSKDDGKTKYAPLVLVPAEVKRAKGNESFSVAAGKEYFVNSTLLEYLKQEFNVDVRGLGGDVSSLKISEILAMLAAETANMKGWAVVRDVYLATFSFQRYLMWNDIRNHFDSLKGNAIVSALLGNPLERRETSGVKEEDEGDPKSTLVLLPADSSQYSAIALSRAGVSFVLHGPPGTGKSQTITNIIANAVNDGKRVLFVAEKKAALDVVKKRLDAIGIGEFCLELHSNKTDKADVLRRMEQTLALAGTAEAEQGFSERAQKIVTLREELKAPMTALHKKRRLGISVYEGILRYLENQSAPDILDIESAFYDSLTESKLLDCKNNILSAAAAAKECGGVFNSPFENVNLSEYSQTVRDRVYCACEVVLTEIKHLKSYLALFLEFYRQKISTVTQKKLDTLCDLARRLSGGAYDKYFAGVTEETFYSFYHLNRRLDESLAYYFRHFKSVVELGKDYEAVKTCVERGDDYHSSKPAETALKRLLRVAYRTVTEEDVPKFLSTLVEIHTVQQRLKEIPLSKAFLGLGGDISPKKRGEFLSDLYALHARCAETFLDFNPDAFHGMCIRAQSGYTKPVLEGYLKAMEAFTYAQNSFIAIIEADRYKIVQEDVLEYFSAKASALIDNIDLLPNWCMYKKTCKELKALGLSFIPDALESGRLTGENVLSGFEKNVYKNFLDLNISLDPDLSRMTVGTIEDTIEKFRTGWEEFSLLAQREVRSKLISRLPDSDYEGSLSVERNTFTRLSKGNLRGMGLRSLFAEVPELMKRVSPCMLMSPITVAQYLEPQADLFDLVIFDEASQMTTAEAIGSIARAKSAIVVGDPKQLPPTAFFNSAYVDEENLENEDLESILDDCLALGLPERHLLWHYRSKHESLIAFSNHQYYGNRLCTFPSPDALDSKVRLIHVDGVYDRGFTKRNRKESEALVAEVVRRLKDPTLSRSSMGIVTFSGAQRADVEKLLTKAIAANKLEGAAYDREEPIFVKNLENVQGDERDVILFSVCYGPDATGRVSLNFGPLNQAGGWRRLNVAVSRAREEMLIFSTLDPSMIDLNKTSSKGVAGLKSFLEFAQQGKTKLAKRSADLNRGAGIGKFIAEELETYGYECRFDVGASDFKIDVAVVDPKNKHAFILAIVCDATNEFSVKDRTVLQVQTLKRCNWNVLRVNCVNYYNNPKREMKRIKEFLDKLTGVERRSNAFLAKYSKPYRAVKSTGGEVAAFITSGVNDGEVSERLKLIVATEEPISRAFLKTRCLDSFGILKSGARINARLDSLIDACAFRRERAMGNDYFYKTDRAVAIQKFRVESDPVLRKCETDFTPFETVALVKGVLEERVSLYFDELLSIVSEVLRVPRPTEKFSCFLRDCIAYGEQKGILVRSVSDRIALA